MNLHRSGRLLCASLTAACCLLPAAGAPADDWHLEYDHDGMTIEVRHVSDSKVKEVRARMIAKAPAERLFAVLRDVERYPEILPPTSAARRLCSDGEGVSYYYMEIDPPIVALRFYCMRVQVTREEAGVLRSAWTTVNELCPESSSGRVRMDQNHGEWTLRPLDGTSTEVTYQAHTDPGGLLPAWQVNLVIEHQVRDILAAVRRAAADPRYDAPRE